MDLFQTIKNDYLNARIEKDNVKKNLLSTLIGDLNKNQKCIEGKKIDPSDEEVLKLIKKFGKNAYETISLQNVPTTRFDELKEEIEILNGYLPKQLTKEELEKEIRFAISRSYLDLGSIMKYLKSKYTGLFDGKITSELIKEILKE
jgi:uncharacterized protein YqeY